jgi:hypothetical protein
MCPSSLGSSVASSLGSSLPSTDWKESVGPDEEARFERYAEALRALQRKRARGGAAARALHAKGQLGLEAEFTVLADLPEPARVGLFAKPATYRAYVRYSNGSGKRQADRKGDVRGVAIKLIGVGGIKIIPGMENAPTQDFLLIRSPTTPFHNADEFVSVVLAAASPFGLLRLAYQLGLGRLSTILRDVKQSLARPAISLATTRYFSAAPIQLGPYAVHYALKPHAESPPEALPGATPDYLGEELADRLRRGPVTYDFQIQFYRDATRTPIEDASVEWKEADAPFIDVGRLTLRAQDPTSPRGRRVAEFVERLSFDPWHAQTELRPLGSMMRARNHAYRLSVLERKAAPEPDGTETFD